jgi:hypothetical protein
MQHMHVPSEKIEHVVDLLCLPLKFACFLFGGNSCLCELLVEAQVVTRSQSQGNILVYGTGIMTWSWLYNGRAWPASALLARFLSAVYKELQSVKCGK